MVVGMLLAIFASAAIVILSILDVITMSELRDSLGRTLSVIAVTTAAIASGVAVVSLGRRR
jgi:hypothetical protein